MARSEAANRLRNFKNGLMSREVIRKTRGGVTSKDTRQRARDKAADAQDTQPFGRQWADFNDSPFSSFDMPRTGLTPPHASSSRVSGDGLPGEFDLAAWYQPLNTETVEERRIADLKKAREKANPHFVSVLGNSDLSDDLNLYRSYVKFLQWVETAHGVQFDKAWIKLGVQPNIGRALDATTALKPMSGSSPST